MLLAGDIGGTKTNLAVFSPEAGIQTPLVEGTLPSRRYPTLDRLVKDFLKDLNLTFEKAVFGVAGPVVEGRAEVTNLPWLVEESALKEALGVQSIHLLNDLESIANSLPVLTSADLQTLHSGLPVATGPKAVIAPGTGLGEAFLTWGDNGYVAHPSEGGHTSFGPTNEEQVELLRFMQRRFAHVSYERVCSGLGIPNIYAFIKETGRCMEPNWLAREIAEAEDVTPIIVQNGLDRPVECEICAQTLYHFVSILGSEAANLALKVLATGGVYIGGGIPLRILPLLQDDHFTDAFLEKGRFADLLQDIPIYVILNSKAALLGAARYGLERL